MRTNYNRQLRRGAMCFGAPRPTRLRIAISPRRLALVADDTDLSEVAARIAEELVLSPELAELMLPARTATLTPH